MLIKPNSTGGQDITLSSEEDNSILPYEVRRLIVTEGLTLIHKVVIEYLTTDGRIYNITQYNKTTN